MKAVVLEAPYKVAIKEVPTPEPGAGEVLVEVKACSICGTDGKMYRGQFICDYPIIPGHEFAGKVVKLGAGVNPALLGVRAGVDYMCPCGECHYCQIGIMNHCVHHKAIGQTIDGGFAEYVVAPASNVYPISDKVSYEEAASLTVLAGAVHSMRRLEMKHGDNVMIFGSGPAGMDLVQMVKLGGAAKIVVTDLSEKRLEMAKAMGATDVVLSDDKLAERLKGIAPSWGFDIVVEATGNPKVLEKAFSFVTDYGKIFVFGISPTQGEATIHPFQIWHKEVSIIGSRSILFSSGAALELIESKRIDVKSMISHRFPLEGYPEAIELAATGNALKIIINPTPE
jgi:2-desacetyl-2-hydroxyethyl bacteriochlorophyllide A dehydrogenase